MANVTGYNRKLAVILRKNGLIEEATFQQVVDKATKEGLLLAKLAVEGGLVDEQTLLGLVAEDSGVPPLDLDKLKIDIEEIKQVNKNQDLITEEIAKSQCIMPIALVGEFLTLAVCNPYDVVLIDNLKLQLQKQIMPVVSTERAILKSIEATYHAADKQMAEMMAEMSEDDDISMEKKQEEEPDEKKDGDLESGGDDSPAVKMVKQIFSAALKKGASDIHIEPMEKRTRVRLRIDGVLVEMFNTPKKLEKAMCSRIKILTDTMNIAERGKPQDGRIQISMEGKKCDVRVNSLPLVYGEKICMRILAKGNLKDMKEIGLEPRVYEILNRGLSLPQGMVLVTGPTGSGKSTTLYSCLKTVMNPEENVNTVEDPVEYELEGINQCHVNPKRGLTFAMALRALLRQDPDTIMIGEIRDQETIEIAVKAALTGHLVLSTLHTNDAPSTITRIIDMGIDPLMVASTVNVVLAQRLGRRLCSNCKAVMTKEELPSPEHLIALGFMPEEIEGIKLWKTVGCSLCNKGYKGRFALVECLEMNNDIRRVIIARGSDIDIRKIAIKTGMISLRRAGLLNCMRGVTSIEDVIGQTIADEGDQEQQASTAAESAPAPTTTQEQPAVAATPPPAPLPAPAPAPA
jgi:type IV pilus assembly protein PilB